jgi:hypothetical protein
MPKLKEILFGKKGKTKQLDLASPEQKELMRLIQEGLTSGEGPFSDIFGSFNEKDFEQGVTEPALKNFQENILPQIQEKFIAGNQVLGSGMRRGQLKAGVDLQSELSKLLYEAKQGQKQNQLSGIQTLLGKQTHENLYKQGSQGAVQGFVQGAGQGVGTAAGATIAGYKMVTVVPGDNSWSDIGKNIGGGFAQGYTNRSDENAIQKAISSLPQDASPRQILDTITGVKTYSPAAKQQAFQNYLGAKNFEELQRKAQAQEGIAAEKLQAQRDIAEGKLQKENQPSEKQKENIDALTTGLETIQKMKEIRKRGNLGIGAGLVAKAGGKTAEDVGAYETYGNTLIPLNSTISIRNQKEFEQLTGKLNNPNITDKEAEGVLNALEGFLSRRLMKLQGKSIMAEEVKRPPLSSFEGKK